MAVYQGWEWVVTRPVTGVTAIDPFLEIRGWKLTLSGWPNLSDEYHDPTN